MAANIGTNYIVSVTVSQLEQLTALRNELASILRMAGRSTNFEVDVKLRGAKKAVEQLQKDINQVELVPKPGAPAGSRAGAGNADPELIGAINALTAQVTNLSMRLGQAPKGKNVPIGVDSGSSLVGQPAAQRVADAARFQKSFDTLSARITELGREIRTQKKTDPDVRKEFAQTVGRFANRYQVFTPEQRATADPILAAVKSLIREGTFTSDVSRQDRLIAKIEQRQSGGGKLPPSYTYARPGSEPANMLFGAIERGLRNSIFDPFLTFLTRAQRAIDKMRLGDFDDAQPNRPRRGRAQPSAPGEEGLVETTGPSSGPGKIGLKKPEINRVEAGNLPGRDPQREDRASGPKQTVIDETFLREQLARLKAGQVSVPEATKTRRVFNEALFGKSKRFVFGDLADDVRPLLSEYVDELNIAANAKRSQALRATQSAQFIREGREAQRSASAVYNAQDLSRALPIAPDASDLERFKTTVSFLNELDDVQAAILARAPTTGTAETQGRKDKGAAKRIAEARRYRETVLKAVEAPFRRLEDPSIDIANVDPAIRKELLQTTKQPSADQVRGAMVASIRKIAEDLFDAREKARLAPLPEEYYVRNVAAQRYLTSKAGLKRFPKGYEPPLDTASLTPEQQQDLDEYTRGVKQFATGALRKKTLELAEQARQAAAARTPQKFTDALPIVQADFMKQAAERLKVRTEPEVRPELPATVPGSAAAGERFVRETGKLVAALEKLYSALIAQDRGAIAESRKELGTFFPGASVDVKDPRQLLAGLWRKYFGVIGPDLTSDQISKVLPGLRQATAPLQQGVSLYEDIKTGLSRQRSLDAPTTGELYTDLLDLDNKEARRRILMNSKRGEFGKPTQVQAELEQLDAAIDKLLTKLSLAESGNQLSRDAAQKARALYDQTKQRGTRLQTPPGTDEEIARSEARQLDASTFLSQIKAIGPKLGAKLATDLDVATLEQLDAAVKAGGLVKRRGVGKVREAAIIEALKAAGPYGVGEGPSAKDVGSVGGGMSGGIGGGGGVGTGGPGGPAGPGGPGGRLPIPDRLNVFERIEANTRRTADALQGPRDLTKLKDVNFASVTKALEVMATSAERIGASLKDSGFDKVISAFTGKGTDPNKLLRAMALQNESDREARLTTALYTGNQRKATEFGFNVIAGFAKERARQETADADRKAKQDEAKAKREAKATRDAEQRALNERIAQAETGRKALEALARRKAIETRKDARDAERKAKEKQREDELAVRKAQQERVREAFRKEGRALAVPQLFDRSDLDNPVAARLFTRDLNRTLAGFRTARQASLQAARQGQVFEAAGFKGDADTQYRAAFRADATATTRATNAIELFRSQDPAQLQRLLTPQIYAQVSQAFDRADVVGQQLQRDKRRLARFSELQLAADDTRDPEAQARAQRRLASNERRFGGREQYAAYADQLTSSIKQLAAAEAAEINTALRSLETKTRQTREFEELSAGVQGFANFMRTFARLLNYVAAGAVVYRIADGISRITGEVIRLDQTVAQIQGVLGIDSLSERLRIKEEVIRSAQEYGSQIQDVAKAFLVFSQAGFPEAKVKEATRASLAAERGAGLNAQQAQELIIAVNALSGGTANFEQVIDRLARVEATRAVSAQDLAIAVQRVGSLAQQLQPTSVGGLDYQDVVTGAVTAIIERTRVSGEQATTSLRFILSRLAAPEVSGKLQRDFGLRLAGPDGKTTRPITDILQDAAQIFQQLQGTTRGSQFLQTFAGARQINAAAALLTGFNDALVVANESANAFGDTQRRLALSLDTIPAQFARFQAALAGALNSIIGGPVFKALVTGTLKTGTSAVNTATEAIGGGPTVLAGAAAGLGILSLFKKIGEGVSGGAELGKLGRIGQVANQARTASGIGKLLEFFIPLGSFGAKLIPAFQVVGFIGAVISLVELVQKGYEAFRRVERAPEIAAPSTGQARQSEEFTRFADAAGVAGVPTLEFAAQLESVVTEASKAVNDRFPLALGLGRRLVIGDREVFGAEPGVRRAANEELVRAGRTRFPGLRDKTDAEVTEFLNNQLVAVQRLNDFGVSGVVGQFTEQAQLRRTALTESLEKLFNNRLFRTLGQGEFKSFVGAARTRRDVARDIIPSRTSSENLDTRTAQLQDVLRDTLGDSVSEALSAAGVDFVGRVFDVLANESLAASGKVKNLADAFDLAARGILESKDALTTFQRQLEPGLRTVLGVDNALAAAREGREDLLSTPEIGSVSSNLQKLLVRSFDNLVSQFEKELRASGASGNVIARFQQVRQLSTSEKATFAETAQLKEATRQQFRDRAVEILAGLAEQRTAQAARQRVFNAIGLPPTDVAQERFQTTRQTVEQLTGLEARYRRELTGLLARQNFAKQASTGRAEAIAVAAEEGPQTRLVGFQDVALTDEQQKALSAQIQGTFAALEDLGTERVLKNISDQGTREFLAQGLFQGIDFSSLSKPELAKALDKLAAAIPEITAQLAEQARAEYEIVRLRQRQGIQARSEVEILRTRLDLRTRTRDQLGDLRQRAATQLGPLLGLRVAQDEVRRRAADQRLQSQQVYAAERATKLQLRAIGQSNDGEIDDLDAKYAQDTQRILGEQLVELQRLRNEFALSEALAGVDRTRQAGSGLEAILSDPNVWQGGVGGVLEQALSPLRSIVGGGAARRLTEVATGPGTLFGKLFGQIADPLYEPVYGGAYEGTYAGIIDALKEAQEVPGTVPGVPELPGLPTVPALPESLPLNSLASALTPLGLVGSAATMAGTLAYNRFTAPGATMRSGAVDLKTGALAITDEFAKAIKTDADTAASKLDSKALLKSLGVVGGQLGGSLAGGGGAGANIGSTLGTLGGSLIPGIGPILGPLLGGVFGGVLGGLFDNKTKAPPELTALERIERNTSETVQAITNQTQLMSLDNRLLNVPASFTVPQYQPNATGGAVQVNIVINDARDPDAVAKAVRRELQSSMRREGTYVTSRY